MNYTIHGPYQLPRNDKGLFTREVDERRAFWDNVEADTEGLPEAVGIYVISVRNVVWYVGMAARQSFRQECMAPHTVTKIDSAISEGSGNAMLHLLAKGTETGRFSKISENGHPDICMLETLLIGISLQRNDELLNKSETAILREIVVPGLYNSPQGAGRANSVQSLKQILGI